MESDPESIVQVSVPYRGMGGFLQVRGCWMRYVHWVSGPYRGMGGFLPIYDRA